jgi:hypothetical protein
LKAAPNQEMMNGLPPPEIIKELGEFDLDPCSPINRPWPTAKTHYTQEDNGLLLPWHGRVFCNPPYGNQLPKWIEKCCLHKNVTALVFARTDTKVFQDLVFKHAYSILFLQGRIKFYDVLGNQKGPAGAPSAIIAFDKTNHEHLLNTSLKGKVFTI